jgi:hypothetical protein
MKWIRSIAVIFACLAVTQCSKSTSPTAPGDLPASQQVPGPTSSANGTSPAQTFTALAVVSPGRLIVQQAEKYVSSSIPEKCNCKEFARRVVKEASGGRVLLPATSSNNYEWSLPSFGVQLFATIKPSSPRPIYGVDAGDIIQMVSTKSGIHTAIVKANMGSYMTFDEANYKACAITSGRSQTFSAFLAEMSGWTAYRISW